MEILTISKHSTYPNHYVKKKQRTENPHLQNIYYITHNSIEHTTNYSHQYYTHHGDGIYQSFGNGMQHQYQAVPQNTPPRHQNIIIVSQARQ